MGRAIEDVRARVSMLGWLQEDVSTSLTTKLDRAPRRQLVFRILCEVEDGGLAEYNKASGEIKLWSSGLGLGLLRFRLKNLQQSINQGLSLARIRYTDFARTARTLHLSSVFRLNFLL